MILNSEILKNMPYNFYRPPVAEHLVNLRFTAIPLIPFRYGLDSAALRRSEITDDHVIAIDNQHCGELA